MHLKLNNDRPIFISHYPSCAYPDTSFTRPFTITIHSQSEKSRFLVCNTGWLFTGLFHALRPSFFIGSRHITKNTEGIHFVRNAKNFVVATIKKHRCVVYMEEEDFAKEEDK